MNGNVDFTQDRHFSYDRTKQSETIRGYDDSGIVREGFCWDNPHTHQDFEDFLWGKTLVATGSKEIRKYKLWVRALRNREICGLCEKPIRISWKGCSCRQNWQIEHSCKRKISCGEQLGLKRMHLTTEVYSVVYELRKRKRNRNSKKTCAEQLGYPNIMK